MNVDWVEASGRGTVHSWTETHHAFMPSLASDLPSLLLTADLDEDVRLLAGLRGPAEGLRVGAVVQCGFEPLGAWAVPVLDLV